MNKYIDFNARHVAALILIKTRSGIKSPVMRNVKLIQVIVPRFNKLDLAPGVYCEVLEE